MNITRRSRLTENKPVDTRGEGQYKGEGRERYKLSGVRQAQDVLYNMGDNNWKWSVTFKNHLKKKKKEVCVFFKTMLVLTVIAAYCLVARLCPTSTPWTARLVCLWDAPGITISCSRGSSWPRDGTRVSCMAFFDCTMSISWVDPRAPLFAF